MLRKNVPAKDCMMKAIVQSRYGGAEVLEFVDVDEPEIDDGQVLVQVHAASIGAWVDHFVAGDPLAMRLQFGLGRPREAVRASDVAGRVVGVGANVESIRPGDEVYGECDAAFAEYAVASPDALSPKPSVLTFEEAAAVPIAGQTALLALRDHGHLQAGQHVLIIGAAGGVGSFAVQIAASMGAVVTGVCSSHNLEFVKSLGADHVVDYAVDDNRGGTGQYDLIVQLAGTQSAAELRRLLKQHGTLVLSSGEGGRWFGPLGRLATAIVVSPFVSQRLRTFVARSTAANLAHLTGLIETGHVTPVIDQTYPLSDCAAALRHFQQPHGHGKTVVTMGQPE